MGVVHLCSYGVNYCRLDYDVLIFGIVIQDFNENTAARAKMVKRVAKKPTMADLNEVRAVSGAMRTAEEEELQRRKDEIVKSLRRPKDTR